MKELALVYDEVYEFGRAEGSEAGCVANGGIGENRRFSQIGRHAFAGIGGRFVKLERSTPVAQVTSCATGDAHLKTYNTPASAANRGRFDYTLRGLLNLTWMDFRLHHLHHQITFIKKSYSAKTP